MKGFYDLPKPVREKLYRMHLVQDGPVRFSEFKAICNCSDDDDDDQPSGKTPRMVPSLLQVSRKIEREASSIYFGENVFQVEDSVGFDHWFYRLWPRHAQQIRKIILEWGTVHPATGGTRRTEPFRKLKLLRMLQSLVVVVDEHTQLRSLLRGPPWRKTEWHDSLEWGPQVQLPMMHVDSMADLRAVRGLRNVEFRHPKDIEQQGSLPGGFLETVVKPEMMQPADMKAHDRSGDGPFRFFDLPPEVRNIVYEMLMANRGVTFPTRGRPTSIQYLHHAKRSIVLASPSVLDLLCVNRQVHDEAEGVFYSRNDFVFTTPAGVQSFVSTLGMRRLDALRSLTFFYKEGRVGNKPDGLTLMESTLSTVRLLRGLRKLHVLVPEPEMRGNRYWTPALQNSDDEEFCPPELDGASYMFKFRNLEDIQVLGPHTVKEQDHTGVDDVEGFKRLDAIFRHFNHSLRLAQKGQVFSELYSDKAWTNKRDWPALGTEISTCGPRKGCLCGQSSDNGDPAEVSSFD